MDLSSFTSLVLVSDVLTETKMKPWWEVARGICVVLMFIFALAMWPLSLTSTIQCLPTFSNMTFTNPEFLYVNKLCYGSLPWNNIKNMGVIVIASALIIHIWYSLWLLASPVRRKFQAVRKANDDCKKLLEGLKADGRKSSEGDYEVMRYLTDSVSCFLSNPKRVVTLYAIRNVVGIFLLLGAIAFSVWLMYVSIVQGSGYKCEIDTGVNNIELKDFTCSADFVMGPFLGTMIVYQVSMIFQCVLTLCAGICHKRGSASQNNECCFNDWKFVLNFAAMADDNLSEKTKTLLRENYMRIVENYRVHIARAVESQHYEFFFHYHELVGQNLGNESEEIVTEETKQVLKRRILEKEVTDEDLKQFSKFCKKVRMYESFVLAHYKNFGQNSEKNDDYKDCGCCNLEIKLSDKDTYTENSLLHYVLTSRTKTEKGEVIFNRFAIKHLLRWRKGISGQMPTVTLQLAQNTQFDIQDDNDAVSEADSLIPNINEEENEDLNIVCKDEIEMFELFLILQECGYENDIGITDGNRNRYNVYRAIRKGGKVTAEMKNLVFGDDKSFYKELSQFWLRNKFYREYVELHKLFYSFRAGQKHENIDCGCNEMTFHLTDTEPGSEGCSLIYYILFLVNLDRGNKAMKHVLNQGRKRQDVSEHREVKVVIRGANSADCSLMDYVNQPQNFNEPDRERLIQTLQEFGY